MVLRNFLIVHGSLFLGLILLHSYPSSAIGFNSVAYPNLIPQDSFSLHESFPCEDYTQPGMERKEVNTVRLTERGMIYARERSHDLEY